MKRKLRLPAAALLSRVWMTMAVSLAVNAGDCHTKYSSQLANHCQFHHIILENQKPTNKTENEKTDEPVAKKGK